ncbi:LPS export ABC transporter permease LptF [Solimonas flava]|uniref:LPS export ABC transporter permease LptF n=1 Tax=Solimonas flava TaxID=415849 RepID=UPI00040F04B5|nr:LPS export ABC transporter permease LptF [Solimonas flava]
MKGVLGRYLLREAGSAWLGVTLVLLAIMLSTRFARYLAQAAAGELPQNLLLQVAALSSLQYLVLLIPVSLLLAVMMALGRLYQDNEIAAMTGCGVGLWPLYRPFLLLGAGLAVLTALLAFQVGPWAGRTSDYLVKDAVRFIKFNPFEEGHFKSIADGRAVVFTERMSADGSQLDNVIAEVREAHGASFVTARSGSQSVDAATGAREVVLEQGYRYVGEPGTTRFDVMHFDRLTTHINPPAFLYSSSKRKIQPTGELLGTGDPRDRAELEWRIGAPIAVFVLALLAVPLSYVRPRQGRYGKLVLGIVAYLIYSQLMGIAQSWVAKDKPIGALGLWWVHGLMLALALFLIARQQNWLRLRGRRSRA